MRFFLCGACVACISDEKMGFAMRIFWTALLKAINWLRASRLRSWMTGVGGAVLVMLVVGELWLRLTPFDAAMLFPAATSTAVFDREHRLLRLYLGHDEQWQLPVRLADVSPWVIHATVAAEDQRFWRHGGIDIQAIVRAALQNLLAGRIVSGASTITMQVVGFSEPRERTLGRKIRQMAKALWLERHATKEEILEVYLTNAPYGGNICGIEAAARRYFGKSARDLTASEAALLAGIPQAPNRYRPDRNPQAAWRRMQYVLARMRETGALQEGEYQRLRVQRPTVKSESLRVANAPHFCDMVRSWYPTRPHLVTTLDLDAQKLAEDILRETIARLAPSGVTNGAVVVLHNPTGEVQALVGSVDYWNPVISGQVNGAVASRAAGSALKPLIYATAFDLGLLLPSSVLYDVPSMFGDYAPENFDRSWRGLIRADKALAWSLNIPAMEVLERVGVERMLAHLERAGVRPTNPENRDYGLSLAVGTCGARLLELTNAYAAIARGGEWRPFRVLLADPSIAQSRTLTAAERSNTAWLSKSTSTSSSLEAPRPTLHPTTRLCSEAACYWVTRALSDPRLRSPEELSPELRGLAEVAWKTGTSNGYRDAWTIAYDGNFTVGVWLGNFDGRPSPALVGARAAAPAALKILRELRARSSLPSPSLLSSPPLNIATATLCAISGELATPDCPTTVSGERLAERTVGAPDCGSPRCSIHRRIRVDSETGERLCPRCPTDRPWHYEVFAFWPAPVAAWLRGQGQVEELPPSHLHLCSAVQNRAPPSLRIVTPRAGETFILSSARDRTFQKLALEAIAPSATQKLFWFLDNELLTVKPPHEVVFWVPSEGTHELRCVDEQGGADAVRFTVRVE